MNIDDLTIGEIKQLRALLTGQESPSLQEECGFQIVVLDRGFVYIGRVRLDAQWCYIAEARNIRYWGTSKGLGELVAGPTKETKLDMVGSVKAPRKALISLISVEETGWKKEFSR